MNNSKPSKLQEIRNSNSSAFKSFVAGMAGGIMGMLFHNSPFFSSYSWLSIIGVLFTCPLEVVKTRYQVFDFSSFHFYAHSLVYCVYSIERIHRRFSRPLWDCRQWRSTRTMERRTGTTFLKRSISIVDGSQCSSLQSFPFLCVCLCPLIDDRRTRYENAKGYLTKHYSQTPVLNAFISSIMAGTVAVTVTCPIWVIKTRLQLSHYISFLTMLWPSPRVFLDSLLHQ